MSDPSSPEPPDPATTSHLLSIPALLLPLSPSLAALHHARVKLHLLPAPGTGPALKDLEKRMKREAKGWCVHCGALRRARAAEAAQVTEADAAAAESGQSAGTSTEVRGTVGKRGRKRKVPPGGPRGRARSAGGGEVVEDSSSIDGPFEAGPSRLASGPADTPLRSESPFVIASNSRNTPTTTPMTKKRHIDCDTCGTPYSRPSPLKSKLARPALPPARVLRKRNSGTVDVPPSTGSTDVFGETTAVAISQPALHAANKVSSSPISTSSAATAPPKVSATPTAGTSTNTNQVAPSRLTSKPAETAKAASTPAVTSKAKPKQAPAFRYIPSTPSTLPTYPPPSSQPPVRPDSPPRSVSSIGPSEIATTGPSGAGTKTGTGAGTGVSVGGSAAAAATARKKSKKSGLAKLLAQSKEREQSGSAGNWGFG